MNLFTRLWWESAAARAANTAIAVLIPLVLVVLERDVELVTVASMVAVAVLGSFATSLAGIPEVTERAVPLWRAVLTRTAKTFGQSLGAVLVGVEVLNDVAWRDAWVVVGAAVLVTLLRTLKDYLPETGPVPIDDVHGAIPRADLGNAMTSGDPGA